MAFKRCNICNNELLSMDYQSLGFCATCVTNFNNSVYKSIAEFTEKFTEPKEELPTYIEPIVGYRAWKINEGNLLCACAHDDMWMPYEKKVANCWNGWSSIITTQSHNTPQVHCSCGIYAFKDFDTSLLSESFIGEVYLWGKIVPHKNGYRAQFAYPKRLWYRNDDYQIELRVRIIADLYGMPAIPFTFNYETQFVYSTKQSLNNVSLDKSEDIITIKVIREVPACRMCFNTKGLWHNTSSGDFICRDCLEKEKQIKLIHKYQSAKEQFNAFPNSRFNI